MTEATTTQLQTVMDNARSADSNALARTTDTHGVDAFIDRIDSEIDILLRSNAHAVESNRFFSGGKYLHASPIGVAHNLPIRSGSHHEVAEASDTDTVRTEDFLGKYCEISQHFKSLPDVARLVETDEAPKAELTAGAGLTSEELSKKIQRFVKIHTPTFSLTPEVLTPRVLPGVDGSANMDSAVSEDRPQFAELDDAGEEYCTTEERRWSTNGVAPDFLQQNTAYIQNDFYQTVSEMGGGCGTATSANESSDSWRDFKASLDFDALRIKRDLEQEFRDKQMRKIVDSRRQKLVTGAAHETDIPGGQAAQKFHLSRKAVANARTALPAFARPLTVPAANRFDPSPSRNADDEQQFAQYDRTSAQGITHHNAAPIGKRSALRTDHAAAAEQRLQRPPQADAVPRESNATTSENETPALSPRETLEKKLIELTEMNLTVRRLQKEKESIVAELRTVRDHLNQYQTELRAAERTAQDSRARAEDVRSELRAIERKRDTTIGELNGMSEELNAKKNELRRMEQRLRKCVAEIEAFEALGINREEIETMIEERNRLIDLVRENEQDLSVRYELEKQLASTQEQARSLEQRLIVEKIEPLEHELNAKLQVLHQVQSEKDQLRAHIAQLEERLVIQENEHTRSLKEKDAECESQRRTLDKQLREVRDAQLHEISHLRAEYEERLADQERRLQLEKEQVIIALKRDVHDTKAHFEAQLQAQQHEMDLLEARHNEELQQLHERLEMDKQLAIKELETKFARELNTKLSELESSLAAQMSELNKQLTAKTEELNSVKQKSVEKEDAGRQATEKLRTDLKHEYDDALQRERTRILEEHEAAWREEVRSLKQETQSAVNVLNEQLVQEHQANELHQRKIGELEVELQAEREMQRQLVKEKLDAITRTRQTVRDELELEYNAQMEILIRKHREESENIRESFRQLERDLDKLRSAKLQPAPSAVELNAANTSGALNWQQTLVLVEELNDECRKVAALLGVRARTVDMKEAREMHELGIETALHHAVANLKASNQLMRKFAEDARLAQEDVQQKLTFANQERSREIARLKEAHDRDLRELQERLRENEEYVRSQQTQLTLQLQTDTERSAVSESDSRLPLESERNSNNLDELQAELSRRDEELRDLRAGMSRWKEDTATRLAKRLQDDYKSDFDRKLNELKSAMKQKWKKRLASIQVASSSQDESSAAVESGSSVDRSRRNQKAPSGDNDILDTIAALSSTLHDVGSQVKSNSMVNTNAATKLITYLQERVKDLRSENLSLRKRMVDSGLPVPEQTARETVPTSTLVTTQLRTASPDRRTQQRSPAVKDFLKTDAELSSMRSVQATSSDSRKTPTSSVRRPSSRNGAQRSSTALADNF